MLLSIPIIVIVKVVAQHVESFQSVAELLAASPPRSPTRSRA
jgi:predicted PurR-regulated permease PerM